MVATIVHNQDFIRSNIAEMPGPLDTPCWIWQGQRWRVGYGMYYGKRGGRTRSMYAHRLAWEVFRQPIPVGLFACHKCDVRACCNPDHIFIGTHGDNMRDACRKGRNPGARKVTNAQVAEIRGLAEYGMTHRRIGQLFGLRQPTITVMVNGKTHPKAGISHVIDYQI